jgi:transcriptional regulator with XRE-family HTH domain
MDDMREVFARNLRRLRHERGLSQEELAHRAEIDRSYVSLLERGSYAASVIMIGKIAAALEVEPAALVEIPKRRSRPPKSR